MKEAQKGSVKTRNILIILAVAFVVIMLVFPLAAVLGNSLRKGFAFYIQVYDSF